MSKYETRKSAYKGTENNAEKLQVRPCELADRKGYKHRNGHTAPTYRDSTEDTKGDDEMKTYIKTIVVAAIAGAAAMQIINMAVRSLCERELHMGGEILLPALVGLVGYIGWNSACEYFKAVKQPQIYRKGFDEGAKIHNYQIVISEEDYENQM